MLNTESDLSLKLQACYCWIKANLAYLLFVSALFLFISKSLYNVPVGIMALIGLYRYIRSPKQIWSDPVLRTYIVLFLCLWLPLLISFIDAVSPAHSARILFSYLRFLFMGIYLIQEIRSRKNLDKINITIFCITAFWCTDAVIQFLFKFDLFGYPYQPYQITGIFYPELTIGNVCAVLSPLYFETIRRHSAKSRWLWLLLIPLFMVILLSGRRAAWISLTVSVIGYLFYLYKTTHVKWLTFKTAGLIFVTLTAAISATIAVNKPMQDRIQVTMGLFSGDYEIIDKATALRLPIWETSLAVIRDNWINGVGPRGFRHVYRQYSDEDNVWFKTSMTHPHQLYLEVMTETGVIGIIGLLFFALLLYQFTKRQHLFIPVFAYLLAVFVAVFPLNTHMAFYGSYSSSIFWWLMALLFSGVATHLSTGKPG